MAKRKGVSASTRWSVFSRDGFTCRYCGARAGQDGVVLHVDHVISVADGGDSSIPNLITACGRCNGGKGARSLMKIPEAGEVAERMQERAKSVQKQAKAMRAALRNERELQQQAVNLKCEAYEIDSCRMESGEVTIIIRLCREFGAETVLEWYRTAHRKRVRPASAIRYVCGIARNIRQQREEAEGEGA
jgi:hypothetical protein